MVPMIHEYFLLYQLEKLIKLYSLMVKTDFRMDIRVQWKKECYQFCTSAHLLWLTSVAWQAGLYQAWLKPLNTDCLTTTFIYKPCILLYKECLKLCFNEIIISKNNNKYKSIYNKKFNNDNKNSDKKGERVQDNKCSHFEQYYAIKSAYWP